MKIRTVIEKESTWAELKALAEAGKLDEVLKSGDNIPVTLKNGEEVSFDVGKNESGKIYFVMHDCLKEKKPMNKDWTNKGGWEKSDMRKYLNEEVIELLPDELKAVIKPTKIVQVWNKRQETEDKLFLLSRTQVFGKNGVNELTDLNDSQIDIFKNQRAWVKELGSYGTLYSWWLRSPNSSNSDTFCSVYTDGTPYNYFGASYSFGVAPAFCI